MSKKLIIIGGVAGGASCATRARRLNENLEITIFEKGPYVSFANCGLPYYIGNVIPDEENLLVATPEMFKDWFNVIVKTDSEVVEINRKKSLVKVNDLKSKKSYYENYDYLLIATGAKTRLPSISGMDVPGVFFIKNIPDSILIKNWLKKTNTRDAIIVGAGFIGIEMAENLTRLGIKVHIIEIAKQIMPSLDKEMTKTLENYISKMGVNVHLDNELKRFTFNSSNNKASAHLKSGDIITGEIIIVASGIIPENKLALSAGIKVGRYGGIVVNECMQTNDFKIWSVGDVVETLNFISEKKAHIPLAGIANRQGRIAAAFIAGKKKNTSSFRGAQGTNVCGFFNMTVASTGLTEKQLNKINKKNNKFEYEKIHVHSYDHAEYYPNPKKITLKLIFSKHNGRVLGAQAFGFSGVEKRIDVISMAIQNKCTVFDLAEAELSYAPQYGTSKDIINISGMVASNIIDSYFSVYHWGNIKNINFNKTTILDVRENFVYKRNHVDGSINIPLDELRSRNTELKKEKEILIYCSEGKRSYFACRILSQIGFNVKSISGGYKMYDCAIN